MKKVLRSLRWKSCSHIQSCNLTSKGRKKILEILFCLSVINIVCGNKNTNTNETEEQSDKEKREISIQMCMSNIKEREKERKKERKKEIKKKGFFLKRWRGSEGGGLLYVNFVMAVTGEGIYFACICCYALSLTNSL